MISSFFVIIALTAFLCNHVQAQGWRAGAQATTLFGVSIGSTSSEVYAIQQTQNGDLLLRSQDRANNNTLQTLYQFPYKMFRMIAVTRNGKYICGSGAILGSTPSCYGLDPSNSPFRTIQVLEAQSMEQFGQSGVAIVGAILQYKNRPRSNGVVITKPGDDLDGYNNYFDIGLNETATSGYHARYGAFPSETTWYITSGNYPGYVSYNSDGDYYRMSQRIRIQKRTNKLPPVVKFYSASLRQEGYLGAISKTTDGGLTWTKVFDSDGQYYFNQISCFDEMNCFAVGENGNMATVLKTSDGGINWTSKLTRKGPFSLHGVNMVSKNEIFVSGGTVSPGPVDTQELVGLYYRSTDGGETWQLSTFNGYGWDMDFRDGVGYAVALFKNHTDILTWY